MTNEMGSWLPIEEEHTLLYSMICSQLDRDGYTKTCTCLREEVPVTTHTFPDNVLGELLRLCFNIKRHLDKRQHGTQDQKQAEIESNNLTLGADLDPNNTRIPQIESDGGVMTSERDVMTPEGGVVTPEGGVMPSEGGVMTSEGGVMTSLSSVFLSPDPSPTPFKEPDLNTEIIREDISLHIQRLISEEVLKRRLLAGDDAGNVLLNGLLAAPQLPHLPSPVISLVGQPRTVTEARLYSLLNTTSNNTTANKRNKLPIRSAKPGSICRFCGKLFSQQSALLVHERIHTGEKPYQCHYCDKAFTQISNLKCHERLHTGEKPYRCNECGKRFTQSASLRCHMRSHTGERPYLCKYCNKRFTQPASLQHHIRIHTGEKPYKCEHCGKCFTQPSSLVVHRRLHTGERPFVCQICGKSYTQAMPLKEHMRTHHSQDKSPLSFNLGQPFSLQMSQVQVPGSDSEVKEEQKVD